MVPYNKCPQHLLLLSLATGSTMAAAAVPSQRSFHPLASPPPSFDPFCMHRHIQEGGREMPLSHPSPSPVFAPSPLRPRQPLNS